jgi:hypothetical protein
VYGIVFGGVAVAVASDTGIDSFGAEPAEGRLAGAGLYDVMSTASKA